MTSTRFSIANPENLRAMKPYVKEGRIDHVAAVWSAARRRNGGMCRWDGRIFASFRAEGRRRIATVGRVSMTGEVVEFAKLKYTPSLGWCSSNLAAFQPM